MVFDFDKVIDRKQTDCIKWEGHLSSNIPTDALPMWVADMDFEIPTEVASAISERANHPIWGYTMLTEKYIDSVCHWMCTRHDWDIPKEWVVVTPNVVSTLNVAICAFTNPGDKVLIQEPVYNPFSRSILANDRAVAVNELKYVNQYFEIDFEDFELKVSDPSVKLFILCNPHNPVGRVWTPEELRKMGELCLAHNVLIVSDEIHQDIVFKPYKHTPIATLSEEIANNLITCTSTGKTFNVASISMGNIIISNPELRETFNQFFTKIGIDTVSPLGQKVVEVGYNECAPWVDALVDYIEGNVNYVDEFIKEYLPMLKVTKSEGTYLLWLDMRELGMSHEELMHFMSHEAKIWVHSGAIFGKCGEGFIRMNVATPKSNIVEALNRLSEAIVRR